MREGEEPKRLDIDVVVDQTVEPMIPMTITGGASSVSLPKDGEMRVAFVARRGV